jgi:hypothetical protein
MSNVMTDTKTKFVDFLNVCNEAIEEHRDEFPFKQLLAAGNRVLGDRQIAVGIYKTDASTPHDYYTVQMKDGRFLYEGHGKHGEDVEWKVKESYLENVAQDPQTYIEHPFKLDWEWLKSRLS